MAEDEVSTPAPGVRRTDYHWGYALQGRRDALLGSGLAPEDWFPLRGAQDARGRTVRTRHSKYGESDITCRQYRGRFIISVRYAVEERERAEEEHGHAELRRHETLLAEREAKKVRAMERLKLAPPVAPDSLTPGERHHIRLLRTVDAESRQMVLDFALEFVAGCAVRGRLSIAQRRLQLVVDNTE